MANYDFVFVYDQALAAWLRDEHLPHPPVAAGNRLPSTADMLWALRQQAALARDYRQDGDELWAFGSADPKHYELLITGFEWEHAVAVPRHGTFTMRGSIEVEVAVLTTVCRRCGQLMLYPDSGAPPVVVDAATDAQRVAAVWTAARQQPDSWRYVFEQLYTLSTL